MGSHNVPRAVQGLSIAINWCEEMRSSDNDKSVVFGRYSIPKKGVILILAI